MENETQTQWIIIHEYTSVSPLLFVHSTLRGAEQSWENVMSMSYRGIRSTMYQVISDKFGERDKIEIKSIRHEY